MPQISDRLAALWGKYDKKTRAHLAAVHHMLDVAMVAKALYEQLGPSEQEWLLSPFCGSKCPLDVLLHLIALHDIGKLTPGFQTKVPHLCDALKKNGLKIKPRYDKEEQNHSLTGYSLLHQYLMASYQLPSEQAVFLANTIASHHGNMMGLPKNPILLDIGNSVWQEAREEAAQYLAAELGFDKGAVVIGPEQLNLPYLTYLAGFCSVVDWIGSSSEHFDYIDAKEYALKERYQIAAKVIAELGIKSNRFAQKSVPFQQLFGFDQPNNLQNTIIQIARDSKPLPPLTIIETPMGSGKTEAALYLADCFIQNEGKAGTYFALPTQASGSQMFERVIEFLRNHPAKRTNIELHLRQGNANLNEAYQALQATAISGDVDADVQASKWFTSSKRGLLSNFAVGTVDQCLLSVLKVKHYFVRLFALSNKVIIIDEVHAYDSYMGTLLDSLMNWMSRLGTPVILLSATLPKTRRHQLLQAYYPGSSESTATTNDYPLVTTLGNDGCVTEYPICSDNEGLPSQYKLHLVECTSNKRWQRVTSILKTELAEGGRAACIVNTVKDAQDLYRQLESNLKLPNSEFELTLFHARFPLSTRLDIENRLSDQFGKTSRNNDLTNAPITRIVIATQVAEQSLDVDFDVMITALAPIDLMLQRMGRLHRHRHHNAVRPTRLKNPQCYCLHPSIAQPTKDAIKIFGYEALFYEPKVLYQTLSTLQQKCHTQKTPNTVTISLPDDIGALVDEVYERELKVGSKEWESNIGQWQDDETMEKHVMVNQANDNSIPKPDCDVLSFFQQFGILASGESMSITRLALPSVRVVFVVKDQYGNLILLPDKKPLDLSLKPNRPYCARLIGASVSISNQTWVAKVRNSKEGNPERIQAPESWSKKAALSGLYMVILDSKNTIKDGENIMSLDPILGVIIGR